MGRRGRGLVVALLVLLVLAVAADRIGARLADHRAEQRLLADGAGSPHVCIEGVPFLTQLLRRRFDDVHVTAASLPVAGGRLRSVDAHLGGVTGGLGERVVARSLRAGAVVTFDQVAKAAGLPRGSVRADGHLLRVTREVSFFGLSVGGAASADVSVRGGRIVVVPRRVTAIAGGDLSAPVASALRDQFTMRFPVPELPKGMRLDGVRVAPAGIRVQVSGSRVRLGSA